MLVLEGLVKAYGATRAVHDVTLTIPAGQFVGVIGRSGAGIRVCVDSPAAANGTQQEYYSLRETPWATQRNSVSTALARVATARFNSASIAPAC